MSLNKIIQTISAFVFAVLLSSAAHAQSWSGFVGLNNSEYNGDGSWDRDFGIDLGASYLTPLYGTLLFRTGGGITQKNSETGSTSVKYTYIEIPLTLYIKANDQIGLFAGLNFDILINSSPSSVHGEETIVINLPIGARFNLGGAHNLEGLVEFGVTDMASSNNNSYKLGNSLAVRYVYTF